MKGQNTAALMVSVLASMAVPSQAQIIWSVQIEDPQGLLTPWAPNIESHILAAGALWALEMQGVATIEVVVRPELTHPRGNGRSLTSALMGTFGSMTLYEMGAAAEIRTGVDPNGSAPDVEIRLNQSYVANELWFDPDPTQRLAPVPDSRTDAMSVMLHELGHAIAYGGWRRPNTGELPGNYLSIWDRWVHLQFGLLFFSGTNVLASWGSEPLVTRVSPFHWGNPPAEFSHSIRIDEHILDSAFGESGGPLPAACCDMPSAAPPETPRLAGGDSLIDELMNGVVFYRGRRYTISDLDRAVLRDCGLGLGPPSAPGQFSPTYPPDDAELANDQVVFLWTYANAAASYEVSIALNSDGSGEVMRFGTAFLFAAPPQPLPAGATYYWTVFATNAYGVSQASGGFRTLRVPPLTPGEFWLGEPTDGSDVPVRNPDLSWSPSARAASYSLVIDDSSDLASPFVDFGGLSETTVNTAFAELANRTRYYWRVRAHNTDGTTTGTPEIASFRTNAPFCLGDANNDSNVNFSDISAVLTNWGLTAPVGDANDDGLVNFADISAVLTHWSLPCP